jgi:hypothetical protein
MLETRLLRDRYAEAASIVERISSSLPEAGQTVLAQTKALSNYPAVAASCFACDLIQIDAVEIEGTPASFSADPSRTFFAFNIGSQTPPAGTRVIAFSCGGRWVFRYDG